MVFGDQLLAMRVRNGLQQMQSPRVPVLCTRVESPGRNDWEKSARSMKFVNGMSDDELPLGTRDNLKIVEWHVNATISVHPDRGEMQMPRLMQQ